MGGYRKIYEDLIKRLQFADIATSARHLGLSLNDAGEAIVPFMGATYLVSSFSVRRADGKRIPDSTASALIHYILQGSRSRPAGQFVTFAELAGPLFKQGSYSQSALEQPIMQRFRGNVSELFTVAESVGGRQGGEAGLGSVSLIFDLLPHILLQLVFYDQDDEFPARTTLLFDRNATQLIDFEALAVLVTVFVQSLTRMNCEEDP
jgi:hypothetical protein